MTRLQLNKNYWNCECEVDYIRSKDITKCPICCAIQEFQPDSREEEVNKKFEYRYDREREKELATIKLWLLAIFIPLFSFILPPIPFIVLSLTLMVLLFIPMRTGGRF